MSNELIPCPFCGGEAEVMIESSYYFGGCKVEECQASGLWHVERDVAVAWWNRRASVWPTGDVAAAQLAEALYEYVVTEDDDALVRIAAAVLAKLAGAQGVGDAS
jgi:hypothetical protein